MKNRLAILFSIAMIIAMPIVKAQTPAPPPADFKADKNTNYSSYNDKVKEYVAWCTKTTFSINDTSLRRKIDDFLMTWITGSPDVTVSIGDVAEPILKDKKDAFGYELLIAYMGGVAVYELNNPKDKDEVNIEYAGLQSVMEMAYNNNQFVADSKAIKKYRSLDREGNLKKFVQDCLANQKK